MDVQQLTILPGRTVWTLRGEAAPAGAGLPPWWDAPHRAAPVAAAAPAADRTRPALVAVAGIALALSVVAAVALLAGARWFVVETPSMGAAAPVGSLVVTVPATDRLHEGDMVAFVPPGMRRTYTHRVTAVAVDGAVRTKGDINAAPDGWTIEPGAVLGRAVAVLPGAGYAVRGLPVLIAGVLLVLLLTLPIRRRDRRAAARIVGLHLVATGVLLWLDPLLRVVLIATEQVGAVTKASVVSTGLLPIRLVDSAGAVLGHLTAGVPEVVTLPAVRGAERIVAVPDLGWAAQAVLVAVAVLPALVVLVVGLPRDRRAAV